VISRQLSRSLFSQSSINLTSHVLTLLGSVCFMEGHLELKSFSFRMKVDNMLGEHKNMKLFVFYIISHVQDELLY